MKKVKVSFDSMWVLSRRSDAVLPVQAFVNELRKAYMVDVATSSLTSCDLLIKSEASVAAVTESVKEVLRRLFDIDPDGGKVQYTVQDDGEEPSPAAETPNWSALEESLTEAFEEELDEAPAAPTENTAAPTENAPEKGDPQAVMERIRALGEETK